jgi:hypothetical protein
MTLTEQDIQDRFSYIRDIVIELRQAGVSAADILKESYWPIIKDTEGDPQLKAFLWQMRETIPADKKGDIERVNTMIELSFHPAKHWMDLQRTLSSRYLTRSHMMRVDPVSAVELLQVYKAAYVYGDGRMIALFHNTIFEFLGVIGGY